MSEEVFDFESDDEAKADYLASEMARLALRGESLLRQFAGLKKKNLRQKLQMIDMQKDMERVKVFELELETLKGEGGLQKVGSGRFSMKSACDVSPERGAHIVTSPQFSPDSNIDGPDDDDDALPSPRYAEPREYKHDLRTPESINSNLTQPGQWSETDSVVGDVAAVIRKKKKKKLKKAGEIFIDDIQGDVCVIVSSTKVIHHVDCHIAAKMNGKEMLMDEARKSGCTGWLL